jgi:hypothetical protein
VYSTLKFIKSKYCLVLTDDYLTELLQTALTTYRSIFRKLDYLSRIMLIKQNILSENSNTVRGILRESHVAREQPCGHPWSATTAWPVRPQVAEEGNNVAFRYRG